MPKISLNDLNKKIDSEQKQRNDDIKVLENRLKLLGVGTMINLVINIFLLAFIISQSFLG